MHKQSLKENKSKSKIVTISLHKKEETNQHSVLDINPPSEGDNKPCCTSLAKSVYKKVLEGAKKAIPHSLHSDKNETEFPRSSGDLGQISVHSIDLELEAETEISVDYDENQVNVQNNGTVGSRELCHLMRLGSTYSDQDDDFYDDESGSPDDIDLEAFKKHVLATIKNETNQTINEPKIVNTYLKESKRKEILQAKMNMEKERQEIKMSDEQTDKLTTGIFRIKNKPINKEMNFSNKDLNKETKDCKEHKKEAEISGSIRDSMTSSEMFDSSTIELPTITISEDQLADSSLNSSQGTLCGSEFEMIAGYNINSSDKRKKEEDTETLKSAVNASERLKMRLKNVSGKVKDLFGNKEKGCKENKEEELKKRKVEQMAQELEKGIVYRSNEDICKKISKDKDKEKVKEKNENIKQNKNIHTIVEQDDIKVKKTKKIKRQESIKEDSNLDVPNEIELEHSEKVVFKQVNIDEYIKNLDDNEDGENKEKSELIDKQYQKEQQKIKEEKRIKEEEKKLKEEEEKRIKEEKKRTKDNEKRLKEIEEKQKKDEERKLNEEKIFKDMEEKMKKNEEKRLKEEEKRIKDEEERKLKEKEKKIKEEEKRLKEEEKRLKEEEKKIKEEEEKRIKEEQEKKLREEEERRVKEEKQRKEMEKKTKEIEDKRKKEKLKAEKEAEIKKRKEERERIERWQKEAELADKERKLRETQEQLVVKAQQVKQKLAEEAELKLKLEKEKIEKDLQRKQEAESKRLTEQLAKLERERAKKMAKYSSTGAICCVDNQDAGINPSISKVTITTTSVDGDQQQHPRLLSSVGNTDDELLLQIESASLDGDVGQHLYGKDRRKILLSRKLRDTRNKLKQLRIKAVTRLKELLPSTGSSNSLYTETTPGASIGKSLQTLNTSQPEMNDYGQPIRPQRRRSKSNKSEPNLKTISSTESINIDFGTSKKRLIPPTRPPPPSMSKLSVHTMDDVNLKDDQSSSKITIRSRTPAEQYYRELLDDWKQKHYDNGDAKSLVIDSCKNNKKWITNVNDVLSRSTPNVTRCDSRASSRITLNDDYRSRMKRKAAARKASTASRSSRVSNTNNELTSYAKNNNFSSPNVAGLPPIAPPRGRLSTAAYLSGSKRSLHRPIDVDYFRPEKDRGQQAVDALFWKPFSWKCGRCRSLTELYVRKQQMSSQTQVWAFENSQQFQLTTQYCAPKRPPPPPRSSSRLLSHSNMDSTWINSKSVNAPMLTENSITSQSPYLNSILMPPESYCSVSPGHSPRPESPLGSNNLPPIPPPPVPPRIRAYHEKQLQTSLDEQSNGSIGSEERLYQSLAYQSVASASNPNSTANASHIYFDADLMTATGYDSYGEMDSLDADISLLSCLSQLNQSEFPSDSNSLTVPKRSKRKQVQGPLPVTEKTIIQVHRQADMNVDEQQDDEDDEDEDTDEIIGIAASLQREIKQLIERRKAQEAKFADNDEQSDINDFTDNDDNKFDNNNQNIANI